MNNICLLGLPFSGKRAMATQLSRTLQKGVCLPKSIIYNLNSISTQPTYNPPQKSLYEVTNTILVPNLFDFYQDSHMNYLKDDLKCKFYHIPVTETQFIRSYKKKEPSIVVSPQRFHQFYSDYIDRCKSYTTNPVSEIHPHVHDIRVKYGSGYFHWSPSSKQCPQI